MPNEKRASIRETTGRRRALANTANITTSNQVGGKEDLYQGIFGNVEYISKVRNIRRKN